MLWAFGTTDQERGNIHQTPNKVQLASNDIISNHTFYIFYSKFSENLSLSWQFSVVEFHDGPVKLCIRAFWDVLREYCIRKLPAFDHFIKTRTTFRAPELVITKKIERKNPPTSAKIRTHLKQKSKIENSVNLSFHCWFFTRRWWRRNKGALR